MLTIVKLAVGYVSNSVGVLSDGVHSFLDLISAAIAYFTIREAAKPADHDHPFGHGKIETLSSLLEALLLIVAGLFIFSEAYDHFKNPEPIKHEAYAIGVTIFSIVISYYTYRHNIKAAHKTESTAIHVNALHFLTDVISSFGVLIALVLIQITQWLWLDALIAFIVAIYVSFMGIQQVKVALQELTDTALPQHELKKLDLLLKDIQSHSQGEVIEAHDLRTRKSGDTRHIDFHLNLCSEMTVQTSHDLCDQIEDKIRKEFPRTHVSIHVEPCKEHKPNCLNDCHYKKKT